MEHGYHQKIIHFVFGENMTNHDIAYFLIKLGWGYTLLFVAAAFVRKLFGAQSAAPYGKFADSRHLTALKVNAKLAWILQEIPALILPSIFCWEARDALNVTQKILLGMFIIHYLQRSVVFPMFLRQGALVPPLTCLMAFGFCSFNGFLQSHTIIYASNDKSTEVYSPRFLVGGLLYAFGLIVNIDSDYRIHQLRSNRNTKPLSRGEGAKCEGRIKNKYHIPQGGFYELVSSANYFGEICEWWGFALAANLNPSATWFAGFTTVFLGLRGLDSHKYYRNTFGDTYPSSRTAVIPYIF